MNKQIFDPRAIAQAGVSGAAIMAISIPLSGVLGLEVGQVALCVSMLYGLQTFLHEDIALLQRLLLFPVVSLTIFASSAGLNVGAVAVENRITLPAVVSEAQALEGSVFADERPWVPPFFPPTPVAEPTE